MACVIAATSPMRFSIHTRLARIVLLLLTKSYTSFLYQKGFFIQTCSREAKPTGETPLSKEVETRRSLPPKADPVQAAIV
jgi:hypothetical protein